MGLDELDPSKMLDFENMSGAQPDKSESIDIEWDKPEDESVAMSDADKGTEKDEEQLTNDEIVLKATGKTKEDADFEMEQISNKFDVDLDKTTAQVKADITDPIKDFIDKPIEILAEDFRIKDSEIISAIKSVVEHGMFLYEFTGLDGKKIILQPKKQVETIDYFSFVAELVDDPSLTVAGYKSITAARLTAYALHTWAGEDVSDLTIDEKYEILQNTDEISLSYLLNKAQKFWKISTILSHPEIDSFFSKA